MWRALEGEGSARQTNKKPSPQQGTRVEKPPVVPPRLGRRASRRAGLTRCRDRNDRGPIPSTLITVAFPARLTWYSFSACGSPVHSALALALISQQIDQLSEAPLRYVLVRFTAFIWRVFNYDGTIAQGPPAVKLAKPKMDCDQSSPAISWNMSS
jgi:hypothetical protein